MSNEKLKIAGGYALISLIWGSTWLAIRIGLDSLTPIVSAGIRFSLASIFVLGLIKINKIVLQTDALSIRLYFILGIFAFVIPYGLVYWAEQFIPSGLASILFAVLPFGVILFSWLLLPDNKIFAYQIIGVIVGFSGIVIIFSEDLRIEFSDYILGMLAVLISGLIQAWVAVIIKKHGKHLHPLSMNFIPLIISGVVMTAAGFVFEDASSWVFNSYALGSIIYLAFFGTVIAFTTYYWLLKKVNIVILSLNTFITPVIAVFLGWAVLNEKFSVHALAGSALVLIGILFANLRPLINYIVQQRRKIPFHG